MDTKPTTPHKGHDIECELTFLPGDRIIATGYRPIISVNNTYWSAMLDFIDTDMVMSGETFRSHITFLYPHYLTEMLRLGKVIHVCDGRKPIAHGTVLKIIDLEENAVIMKQWDDWYKSHPTKTEYRNAQPQYKRKKDKK